MSAIVLVAGIPSLPLERPRAISAESTPEELSRTIDWALSSGQKVILVEPAWHQPLRAAGSLALSMLGVPAAVARVPIDLPPLAVLLVAEQLGWLTEVLAEPGAALLAVETLTQGLLAAAWMRDVTRLTRPAPSLRQYLRSFVPGTSFLVLLRPRPRVSSAQASALARWSDYSIPVVFGSGSDSGGAWLRTVGMAALPNSQLMEAASGPLTKEYYGADDVCEIAASKADLNILVEQLAEVRLVPCAWCGTLTAAGSCAFCRSSRPTASTSRRT